MKTNFFDISIANLLSQAVHRPPFQGPDPNKLSCQKCSKPLQEPNKTLTNYIFKNVATTKGFATPLHLSHVNHFEPPGHDHPQPGFVFDFLPFSHLPTMLNLPLVMRAAKKMLKEMLSSSKFSLRFTTRSSTDSSDNPSRLVFSKCKSTST